MSRVSEKLGLLPSTVHNILKLVKVRPVKIIHYTDGTFPTRYDAQYLELVSDFLDTLYN